MKYKEFMKLSKEDRKKVPFKNAPIASKIGLFTVIACILTVIIVAICDPSGTDGDQNKKAIIDTLKLELHTYSLTKEVVKQNLKSPASASFPDNIHFGLLMDNSVIIKGYVDSQNSFGAMLRTNYYIKWKYLGGDIFEEKNLKFIEFEFEN